MEDLTKNELLRALPSVEEVLSRPSLEPILAAHPRARGLAAVRTAVARARARLLSGKGAGFDERDVAHALDQAARGGLRRVLNATGVVLHTNLGRAPLAEVAMRRILEVAGGYSNLELDLETGERGERTAPLVSLLRDLTGAEDALVVNNNAGAVLLVLAALARGKEAIVSRGELVEIGGGFRIPEVMAESGATLVEVGTTNRTRLSDYEQAVGPSTAILVKVHRSNFAVVGYTGEVSTRELAGLSRSKGVPLFEDLGSGALVPMTGEGLGEEPQVFEVLRRGADLCSFSGDKLLGGPQAGVIVGKREWISKLKRHPLTRALRLDKLGVASLEATLELLRDGRLAEVPAIRMLGEGDEPIRARAERLGELLAAEGVSSRVVPTVAQVGGGAMPLWALGSYACAVDTADPEGLKDKLRGAEVPVIARVSEGALFLDLRCLSVEDLPVVAVAVRSAQAG